MVRSTLETTPKKDGQLRRTLGSIAAVATVMSLIGVAWASDDVGGLTATTVKPDAEIVTSVVADASESSDASGSADSTPTTMGDEAASVTSIAGITSDTIEDDRISTSTTVDEIEADENVDDSVTSTTLDEDDLDDEDDGEAQAAKSASIGAHTYAVSGVGEVTIEVLDTGLRLVAVNAPAWTVDIEKSEADRIKVEFRRGEDEAEFEAELHSNGGLSIEIDGD